MYTNSDDDTQGYGITGDEIGHSLHSNLFCGFGVLLERILPFLHFCDRNEVVEQFCVIVLQLLHLSIQFAYASILPPHDPRSDRIMRAYSDIRGIEKASESAKEYCEYVGSQYSVVFQYSKIKQKVVRWECYTRVLRWKGGMKCSWQSVYVHRLYLFAFSDVGKTGGVCERLHGSGC